MIWFIKKARLGDALRILDLKKMKCSKPARLKDKKIYRLKPSNVCQNLKGMFDVLVT